MATQRQTLLNTSVSWQKEFYKENIALCIKRLDEDKMAIFY